MLKKEITYKDYDDEEQTETLYFNISKPEMMDLYVSFPGGFGKLLQNIVTEQDPKELVEMFKRIIKLAYGKKSEDGRRFIKDDQATLEFTQSAAYETLYMEMLTEENAASDFMKSIIPTDFIPPEEVPTKDVETKDV